MHVVDLVTQDNEVELIMQKMLFIQIYLEYERDNNLNKRNRRYLWKMITKTATLEHFHNSIAQLLQRKLFIPVVDSFIKELVSTL